MEPNIFSIEAYQLFSKSRIWEINRSYYQETGILAWRSGEVPHHMTSNSMVGKTYAKLLLGFLQDLAAQGQTTEKVYILELGAGHGRLAFHILHHLQRLEAILGIVLPPYCYVLSDIVENNLEFFQQHPQFKKYIAEGKLDCTYFDAAESKEIHLRHQDITIQSQDLQQPIVAIGNYFFDSLPNDLFYIKDDQIEACEVAIDCVENPAQLTAKELIEHLSLSYRTKSFAPPFYSDSATNEILESYRHTLQDSHLFFPVGGIQCLKNIKDLSQQGLMLLSMDKGNSELSDLQNVPLPDLVKHGSFSFWVNYHALGAFCEKEHGTTFLPEYASFYLQMTCFLFLPEGKKYGSTNLAYQLYVNDFGPDDFNGIKRMTYRQISRMTLKDLISIIRLSAYDSIFFIKLLPRLKQVTKQLSALERHRFTQTLEEVWKLYYSIEEPYDLAYELGGLLYDLGSYKKALIYFEFSVARFGVKADIFYNQGLCYYQLREDTSFNTLLLEAQKAFPEDKMILQLGTLDLNAV